MDDWDPDLYRRFEAERTRPAADLLAHVGVSEPRVAYDLGCGPGNSTELLAARFPRARLIGVDTSEAMLASARGRLPACHFERDDIADWCPSEAPDLIFANAVLHWVPDHRRQLPRLLAMVRPGGVLAVQVPDNLEEPSHRLMREVAARYASGESIGAERDERARTVLTPESYYELLAKDGTRVDVWRTIYHHPMPTAAAFVTWFRSTGLRPFLDRISP